MIGAIIGDLAAWTYENDKDTFWKQLFSEDCEKIELSVYGHAYFRAASRNVIDVPDQDVSIIRASEELSLSVKLKVNGQWLMWQLMCAWHDNLETPRDLEDISSTDKEEGYARMFVIGLIRCLRKGMTKSEAYHSVDAFENLSKSWEWKSYQQEATECNNRYSILSCVFRAWDSFYRGFDFTSSVHNAMKWEGDRHLIAILTASFASAMYGCKYNLIKKKYAKDGEITYTFDLLQIGENFGYHHALCNELIGDYSKYRTFYPKNMALTNVERHHWKDTANLYEYIFFSESQKQSILMCSPTGWDNRYGLYLDDGWMYVYRSGCLIGRFQLKERSEKWHISNTQLSGERSWAEFCNALSCALNESCHLINLPILAEIQTRASMCKYYQGEKDCPSEWKDTTKGKFWYGEMRFCTGRINIKMWSELAAETIESLTGEALQFAQSMPIEKLGMVLYIEALFQKWCPYDDTKWIFEY